MQSIFRTSILTCLLALAAFAHDVTGKWTFNVQTDMGSGSPTFVFKQDGEKLTGTYSGTFGTAELTGTVKGDDIKFTFEAVVADQKGTITYTGKIESAAKMKGTVEFAGIGGTWTGTKD